MTINEKYWPYPTHNFSNHPIPSSRFIIWRTILAISNFSDFISEFQMIWKFFYQIWDIPSEIPILRFYSIRRALQKHKCFTVDSHTYIMFIHKYILKPMCCVVIFSIKKQVTKTLNLILHSQELWWLLKFYLSSLPPAASMFPPLS